MTSAIATKGTGYGMTIERQTNPSCLQNTGIALLTPPCPCVLRAEAQQLDRHRKSDHSLVRRHNANFTVRDALSAQGSPIGYSVAVGHHIVPYVLRALRRQHAAGGHAALVLVLGAHLAPHGVRCDLGLEGFSRLSACRGGIT